MFVRMNWNSVQLNISGHPEMSRIKNVRLNRVTFKKITAYCISSNSFFGNYSFLNLEIQRSQYINMGNLFKGGNYMRKYGIPNLL